LARRFFPLCEDLASQSWQAMQVYYCIVW